MSKTSVESIPTVQHAKVTALPRIAPCPTCGLSDLVHVVGDSLRCSRDRTQFNGPTASARSSDLR